MRKNNRTRKFDNMIDKVQRAAMIHSIWKKRKKRQTSAVTDWTCDRKGDALMDEKSFIFSRLHLFSRTAFFFFSPPLLYLFFSRPNFSTPASTSFDDATGDGIKVLSNWI